MSLATEPRFFIDENLLSIAKAMHAVRRDVVYPGLATFPQVPRAAKDEDWLHVVGAAGLAVITRDKRIRYRPIERALWVRYSIRGFCLTSNRDMTSWDRLSLLVRMWFAMEEELARPGPWMMSVTMGGLKTVDLS